MGPTTLTLLRHGESDWNLTRRCQGQDDRARLTDDGRIQARRAVDALRARRVDLVVSSGLSRALETADCIADALGRERVVDLLVRERSFGCLEGGPLSAVTADQSGIDGAVLVDPDARPAGGESFRDVAVRAQRFLEKAEVAWPDRHVLVVTHGGFIRALRAVVAAAPLEGLVWYPVGNCSVWTVEANARAD